MTAKRNLGRIARELAIDAHVNTGRAQAHLADGFPTADSRALARGFIADAIGHLATLRAHLETWDRLAELDR